eukprot:CAMPEP_0171643028 /NCGR_PEP_ID=MMETSP0990-20121206/32377_1 /TAXON_ID=483369 /ORGANISM="non described non described, Strain CCMP2098" /LENGTH=43 /DNA_ID= /DNA_START= /DNA_END= /DNA_ORIENTATION=
MSRSPTNTKTNGPPTNSTLLPVKKSSSTPNSKILEHLTETTTP